MGDYLEREPPSRPSTWAGPVTAGRPLPYGDPAHLAAHQFLVEEAALLDAADYAGWLELLCEDIRYLMPVRVTTARGAGFDSLADMGHFDEDMYALRKRVQRLATDHAWTEDPPSRTRHFVTNVRTFRAPNGELRVESALLLFRSRGDTREADLISAGRTDLLRETATGCGWPGGRSPWTSRCCAPRTWRCSCDVGGRDPAGQRVHRGRGGAGADPQRRPAAHLGAGLGPEILLCPLELEALTWQDHDLFSRLLQTPHGPEDRSPADAPPGRGLMGWLDGKRALVAGAGSGIGRAVLAAFRAEGARVAALELDQAKAGRLAAELPGLRGQPGRRHRRWPTPARRSGPSRARSAAWTSWSTAWASSTSTAAWPTSPTTSSTRPSTRCSPST